LENADVKSGRSAGLSKESAGEASNLMWRPVQRRNRDTTTSACVGWDIDNIENQLGFRKMAKNRAADRDPPQIGLTTTSTTIPIIKKVGTSLIIR
jgi:hypothetical protein